MPNAGLTESIAPRLVRRAPQASNALSQRGMLRWCRDTYESVYVSDVASWTTIVDRTNTIATRSSAANLATEMMDEVPRATTQSISPLGRPPVHRWLHHNESMTAAAAAAQRENDVADTSVYVAVESGVALTAAGAPTALETIDATVKRSKVSADAPVESPSDQRAFWEGQREVLASDAPFQRAGGAAFGMSSAMAPPLAEGVPGAASEAVPGATTALDTLARVPPPRPGPRLSCRYGCAWRR